VFPDEYHLHTLDQFLSAIARLNPQVNTKAIVIGLMDRLSAYAAREAEGESPEEKAKNEEEATSQLFEKLKLQKEAKESQTTESENTNGETADGEEAQEEPPSQPESTPEQAPENDEKEQVNGTNSKRRNIPENVKLFEVFHEQVISLIKMQRLPIQDITALLVSLANLAL
jgi:vacuolar protein sorting-associated protein 35